jgi:hypothetical protein
MIVDGLASLGWEFGEDLVIFEHPPQIKQYVAADVLGVCTPCLILL